MQSNLFAAAMLIALGSSSVVAIGVGSRITVRALGDSQAHGLGPGNTFNGFKYAPTLKLDKIGFTAKRAGPQTGPGGFDFSVYSGVFQPPSPLVVVGDSNVAPLNLGAGSTIGEFRVMLDSDGVTANYFGLINTASGSRDAIITGTQANSTVIAQTGTIVPGTGGRKLLSFDQVMAPIPAGRTLFNGDLGFPSGPGGEFCLLASNDDGLKPALLPGDTFHLPLDTITIDFVDRALLSSPAPGADPIGLVLGGGQSATGDFGPFVGTVRIPATGDPLVTPILVPGQASPPALAAGTILNWIDMAVGPGNQGALTVIVQTPTEFVEQTAIFDLASPDPLASAALLVAQNTPVVASPSTAGFVPNGTVMVQHYDRIYFSGNRMYLPIYAQFPTFQTPVALVSAVPSSGLRSAMNAPLVTELRALLLTQAPAPALSGPKIQSIDKVAASGDGYAVVEVTLSGTGVNATNNTAWYMCTPGDDVVLLVREGQSLEVAPGVFKVLNAIAHHSNCNTGDGLPISLGSNGTWAFQADLNNFSTTAICVATIEGDCPADLNSDGLVEDADFVIFLAAYNILDCLDPAMSLGCPADLNGDAVVDDADFVAFLAAYNELVCP